MRRPRTNGSAAVPTNHPKRPRPPAPKKAYAVRQHLLPVAPRTAPVPVPTTAPMAAVLRAINTACIWSREKALRRASGHLPKVQSSRWSEISSTQQCPNCRWPSSTVIFVSLGRDCTADQSEVWAATPPARNAVANNNLMCFMSKCYDLQTFREAGL